MDNLMTNDKTIRAVIFDLGGVLIRSLDKTPRRKWEIELGLPENQLSHLAFGSDMAQRAMLGDATEEDVWRDVANTLNLNADQMRDLVADFWSCESLNIELANFARALRPKYQTAILSNAFSSARQAVTENFQLDEIFDPMIISGEVRLAKPDARIFHLTAQRIGVAPHECVFIDDVHENIESARAVGMRGVQFVNTVQAIAEAQQYLEISLQ